MTKGVCHMNELLPDYQKFLLDHKLAQEKNISFLAYWVSRYLRFAERKGISQVEYRETAVVEFLEQLRADQRTTEWQARQADDAIRLYYFHYLCNVPPYILSATALPPICFSQE